MHRFRLGLADLAAATFACSPLHETVLGLRMWAHPGVYVHQTRAFERLRPAFERCDTELLLALVAGNRFVPDFLTPRPVVPFPDFAAELAAVRAFDPALLRTELELTHLPHGRGLPPLLAEGLADPPRLLARIADALAEYFERCLAPEWWPRARSVLHADLVHRSRILAERGAAALLSDLDRRLFWADGVLTLRHDSWNDDADILIEGRGLVFVPTCFARGACSSIDPHQLPMISYPARGLATLAGPAATPPAPRALEQLIGAPKARLLALLEEPTATVELARRLGVTPGAVSQHLAVLADTRLVTRARHGRVVLYARSPLADQLLN